MLGKFMNKSAKSISIFPTLRPAGKVLFCDIIPSFGDDGLWKPLRSVYIPDGDEKFVKLVCIGTKVYEVFETAFGFIAQKEVTK
jgi:predicted DNA-binding antitoxin AbrB/MazE fold protein